MEKGGLGNLGKGRREVGREGGGCDPVRVGRVGDDGVEARCGKRRDLISLVVKLLRSMGWKQ